MPTIRNTLSGQRKVRGLTLTFCSVVAVVSVHIAYVLVKVAPGNLAWLGAAAAVWPLGLLLIRLSITQAQRQVATYFGLTVLAAIGFVIALYGMISVHTPLWPLVLLYALVVGLGGIVALDRGLVLNLQPAESAVQQSNSKSDSE